MSFFDRLVDFYNPKLRPLQPLIAAYGHDRSVLDSEEAKGGSWVRLHRAHFVVIDPTTGQARRSMNSSAHIRGNPEHMVMKLFATRKVLLIPWPELQAAHYLGKHVVGFVTAQTPANRIQIVADSARQVAAQSAGQWQVLPPPPG